jgi:hypothetical protein
MATNNSDFKVKKGLIVSEGITLGGHTFDDIDIGSEFVDTDDHIMSSGAIKEKIEDYGYTTATGDMTLSGTQTVTGAKTFTATLAVTGNNQLQISDGGASAPKLNFADDTDTGIYRPASGQIGFTSNGTAQIILKDGVLEPVTNNDVDLGSSSLEFKDGYFDGTLHCDVLDLAGTEYTSIGGDTNAGGVDGSAGSPTFSFSNDDDTGFYLDGVNTIGIALGGSRKFRIYADTFRMDGTTDPQVIKCDSASVDLELRSGGSSAPGTIHIGRENQDIEITPGGTGEVVLAGASKANKISVVAITSTTTLTDAQSGSYVYVTGSGAPTLPATAEVGQQYTIINNTGSDLTPGLGTSNSTVPSSHTAISDDKARTYIGVAANTWFFVG